MHWKPFMLLFLLSVSKGQAAELACPQQWPFAGGTRTLAWGEFWAGDQSLDPRASEYQKRIDHHFTDVWNMDKEARPAFIRCRYGSYNTDFELIVTLPDDIQTCERDGIAHDSFDEITLIECRSSSSPNGATIHLVETATLATDIYGFQLHQSPNDVKKTADTINALTTVLIDNPDQIFEVNIPQSRAHLQLITSATSGVIREIILFGPTPNWSRFDFYREIASRFGVWDSIGPLPNTLRWRDHDGVRIEWWQGDLDRKIPETMHLIDMTDPESQRLHPTE